MRPALAWALADRRDPQARPVLLGLTKARAPRLVAAGAYGLALLDARTGLPTLVEELRAPEPARRRGVTAALCRWPAAGRSVALPALQRLLAVPAHRAAAEAVLGCWQHPLGLPALRHQLRAPEATQRRQAIRLIADVLPPDLAEQLIPALEDVDAEVSRLARVQLLRLGSAAVPALEKAIQTGSARARAQALRLAWWLGAALPMPLLYRLATSGTPATRALALALIGRLRSPAAPPLVFLSEAKPGRVEERTVALATLASLPDERAWPVVKTALRDPAEPVRIVAWKQLDRIPLALSLAEQATALKSGAPTFQDPPWPSFSHFGDRRLIPALWASFDEALKPEDRDVGWHYTIQRSAEALVALAGLGERRAFTGPRLRWLFAMLSSHLQHEKVLPAALAALREISGRPLTEAEQLDPPSP